MAKYNTFIVQKTNGGRTVLVTSSARKAAGLLLASGYRVEVWNENQKIETLYYKTRAGMKLYIQAEREYLRAKQAEHEARNQRRRERLEKYQK